MSKNNMQTRALLFLSMLAFACGSAEVKEVQEYKGPLREVENMELFYSESSVVKVKMRAPIVYEFLNGDREFPKGIHIEFYDAFGKLESTLDANHAYYFKEENKWRGRGDVVVKNVLKKEQLNTEELFWKPAEHKIFTDKFVTIRQQGDVIYGEGMEANEDLSDFEITRVTGDFEVKENEEL
jgi:LPS export ABC transporter protein LptC